MTFYSIIVGNYDRETLPIIFDNKELARSHADMVEGGEIQELTLVNQAPHKVEIFHEDAWIYHDDSKPTYRRTHVTHKWDYEITSEDELQISDRKSTYSDVRTEIRIWGLNAQQIHDKMEELLALKRQDS